MQAIILAGGFGTRLKSAVPDLPKPMAPVNGVPFLEKVLDFWIDEGVDSFIFSVHYRWETIRAYFGEQYKGVPIQYAVEFEPLGTGGAIINAQNFLDSSKPYLVVNGDTFFEVDFRAMQAFHLSKSADVTLALAQVTANTRYSGIKISEEGRLHSFSPQGPTADCTINGGIYLINSTHWGPVRKISLESELFPQLISEGKKIYGFVSPGRFLDIGIPEDYHRAESMLA